VLATLPVTTTVMAVSGDQQKLFAYDPTTHGLKVTLMDHLTPITVSVASADAGPDWVRIVWYSTALAESLFVQRWSVDAWSVVGRVAPDGSGMLHFEDFSVAPGTRYQYRLSFVDQTGSQQTLGGVWVDTRSAPRFALHGVYPNPVAASTAPSIRFSLPTRAKATLEVIDVQGRVVWKHTLAAVESGDHSIPIDSSTRLRAGVYFLRLEQGDNRATKRLIVIH
jgi:hypothetical protein